MSVGKGQGVAPDRYNEAGEPIYDAMTPDWLSEVLDGIHIGLDERGRNPAGATRSGKLKILGKTQAHKLISAQLIREQQDELGNFVPIYLTENGQRYVKERYEDLTNQLKEVEDENS